MTVRLYVGNIPFRATPDDVSAAFAEVVQIDSIYLPTDRATGRPRGYGFIEVLDAEHAEAAIRMLDGRPILGRPVVVHHARPREQHPPRRLDSHAHRRQGRGPRDP